jgi:carboxyl-terminal processing protease
VEQVYNEKISQDTTFQNIRKNAEWLSQVTKKEVSLNLSAYQQMQKEIKVAVKQNDSLQTLKEPLNINFMQTDDVRISKMDKEKAERFRTWLKNLKNDIYLDQTAAMMNQVIINDKMAKN